MTIQTTTSSVTYQGNGSTLTFTFPFVGDSSSVLIVTYTDSVGAETVLNPSVYTLVLNAPAAGQLWGIGGSVTYPNTGSPPVPISAGTYISITRAVPYEQTVTISNQGPFYPQAVERALDLLEMQIQQWVTGLDYALRTPTTDPAPPNVLPGAAQRAGGYLAFDDSGQPIVLFGSIPPVPSTDAIVRRVLVTGTTTVNVLTSDAFGGVALYQSGTPVTTVQLPTDGGPYPVFDGSGNAGTYQITVLPPSGKLIAGQTAYYIAFNNQSSVFYWDGLQYLIQ